MQFLFKMAGVIAGAGVGSGVVLLSVDVAGGIGAIVGAILVASIFGVCENIIVGTALRNWVGAAITGIMPVLGVFAGMKLFDGVHERSVIAMFTAMGEDDLIQVAILGASISGAIAGAAIAGALNHSR